MPRGRRITVHTSTCHHGTLYRARRGPGATVDLWVPHDPAQPVRVHKGSVGVYKGSVQRSDPLTRPDRDLLAHLVRRLVAAKLVAPDRTLPLTLPTSTGADGLTTASRSFGSRSSRVVMDVYEVDEITQGYAAWTETRDTRRDGTDRSTATLKTSGAPIPASHYWPHTVVLWPGVTLADLQTRVLITHVNGVQHSVSSVMQMLKTTLRELKRRFGLDDDERVVLLFTLQDRVDPSNDVASELYPWVDSLGFRFLATNVATTRARLQARDVVLPLNTKVLLGTTVGALVHARVEDDNDNNDDTDSEEEETRDNRNHTRLLNILQSHGLATQDDIQRTSPVAEVRRDARRRARARVRRRL